MQHSVPFAAGAHIDFTQDYAEGLTELLGVLGIKTVTPDSRPDLAAQEQLSQGSMSLPGPWLLNRAHPGKIQKRSTSAVRFQVQDRSGSSHVFSDIHIRYPGGSGPMEEKRGIKVYRGSVEVFIEWQELKAVEFIRTARDLPGEVKYGHIISVASRDGTKQTVQLVPDWNMTTGGTGLLFGRANLGDTAIQFTDIFRIEILRS